MSRKMLIDAAHREETRVVVVENNRVEEFDYESASKKPIRGNIYLARVTRVEPSLQAAFVEYGGNKHGFLAFNEIHPDYYQIPHEDREALRAQEEELTAELNSDETGDDDDETQSIGDEDELIDEVARKRRNFLRKYKIQEVIKRRQVLLIQVVKEERGNKGAALTTYLSLAGRYCVLMPNTARGGGISRKITNASDRKRLKSAVSDLSVPNGMGLIIRTAGASRTKTEIKRDYDYLIRLWENIRTTTLESSAPALIYEEGNLVKRVIRDLYDKDIEEVLIHGDAAYKEAKAFMRMLMPSHAKKVQAYKDDTPLFLRYQVESQLEAIHSPTAQLKSGGYLVINPTEALVAIDVNSGKSTRERNIEQTALRTNVEAAEEAARQMRLRDLAGLLVIDFIDMEENKNVRTVEKKMKDALKRDRARLQMGRISQFGLMEMSRQRRRTSLVEGSTDTCPTCGGLGYVRSIESSALVALRTLEEEGVRGRAAHVRLSCPTDVTLYMLNDKREALKTIEELYDMRVTVTADDSLVRPACELERLETRKEAQRADAEALEARPAIGSDGELTKVDTSSDHGADISETDEPITDEFGSEEEGERKKRRRRGRRGGRNRRRRDDRGQSDSDAQAALDGADSDESASSEDVLKVVDPESESESAASASEDTATSEDKPKRRTRRRRKKTEASEGSTENTAETTNADSAVPADASDSAEDIEAKPKRRTRKRKASSEKAGDEAPATETFAEDVAETVEGEARAKPKRRTRRKKAEPTTAADADAASDSAPKPAPEPAPAPADAAPAPQGEPSKAGATGDASDDGQPRKTGWWQRSSKFLGIN